MCNLLFVQVDVIDLLFGDGEFDVVMMLYVLCNVNDLKKVLCELYCVIKLGGWFVINEFFILLGKLFCSVYCFYNVQVLLCVVWVVGINGDVYDYFNELICEWFDQKKLLVWIWEVGWVDVVYWNFLFGIVVLYRVCKLE